MKVAVLTTSYPRGPGDGAGVFVARLVEAARLGGIEMEVVAPAGFPHFGLAYGHGLVGNLKAAPWLALLLPAFLASFALAARRAARDADVVHAHWLPAGLVALATGKPLVVQPWGTDVELARRAPWLARFVLRRARLAVAASAFLAAAAEELGARDVRVVPVPVDVPDRIAEPDSPPHVLYAGRLSEEKGILEFLEATEGLPRVIAGDGPLRHRVPDALGWVPPDRLGERYDRAAVVCVPSRREGYGMVAREAMAHGRPVVASAVGGLADAVVDGETGVLVPPGDAAALRTALVHLLRDEGERLRLGVAAWEAAQQQLTPEAAGAALYSTYVQALRRAASLSTSSAR